MSRIDQYINQVLEQIQSPKEERQDIREELLTHIYEAKMHYMNEGFSDKGAENKALSDFGKAYGIGKDLQEAMYPFQRGLLYTIGIAALCYGAIFYLNYAFNLHELIPDWLAIQLTISSVIILCAINISFIGRHFYVLHTLIFIMMAWMGFNIMVVEMLPGGRNIFFTIYLVILIGLCLVFMFRNSYLSADVSQSKSKERTFIKLSYILNLIFGIILTGGALFFMWIGLIMVGMSWGVVLPLIPLLAWLIFYKFHINWIAKKPFVSIFTGLVFSILAFIAPIAILILF